MTREEGAALTQRGDAKTERVAAKHADKKVGEEQQARQIADAEIKKLFKKILSLVFITIIGVCLVTAAYVLSHDN
jgi:hypothetical protein